jgi:hypothetical protein
LLTRAAAADRVPRLTIDVPVPGIGATGQMSFAARSIASANASACVRSDASFFDATEAFPV